MIPVKVDRVQNCMLLLCEIETGLKAWKKCFLIKCTVCTYKQTVALGVWLRECVHCLGLWLVDFGSMASHFNMTTSVFILVVDLLFVSFIHLLRWAGNRQL